MIRKKYPSNKNAEKFGIVFFVGKLRKKKRQFQATVGVSVKINLDNFFGRIGKFIFSSRARA